MRLRSLLWAVVALLLFAGCVPARGPDSPTPAPTPAATSSSPLPAATPPAGTPAGPVVLTYWEEDLDTAGVVLDELAAQFMEAHPNIMIRRIHYTYEDLRTQFRDMSRGLMKGDPPDLVRGPGEYTGPFSELDIVHEADALYSADFLGQYLPGALDGATVRGRVWALPDNFGNHLMLFYNRALVQAPPADTDAWITQLKSLTDAANGQYGLTFAAEESYWIVPWLAGFGGWPLDAEDRPALDTAEMIEALWFVADLKNAHLVMPLTNTYEEAFKLFGESKAAYVIDGRWNLAKYQELGLDVGIATLPRVTSTGMLPAPMATGQYWFLARKLEGDRLQAAMTFTEFMTSEPAQEAWLSKLSRLPSSRDTANSPLVTGDPQLAAMVAQLKVARGVPPALEMTCAWRGMDTVVPEVMRGNTSPDKAAPAMQEIADQCMAEITLDPTPGATPAATP